MKHKIIKSFYSSIVLEIEADTEKEALEIAEGTKMDLDENLGYYTIDVE